MGFFDWLFHTSTGVIVLIVALMVIVLIAAALLEKGTRRKYADLGPRPEGVTFSTAAATAVRQRADKLVDQVDDAIDEHLSPKEEAAGEEFETNLVGALEDLWDRWDKDLRETADDFSNLAAKQASSKENR